MFYFLQNLALIDIPFAFIAFHVPQNVYFDTMGDLLSGFEDKILALIDMT